MEMLLQQIKLPFHTRKKGDVYVASCAAFDIHMEGSTESEATLNLISAVKSFLNICIELGTLDEILEDCGVGSAEHGSASLPPYRFSDNSPFSQN